MHHFETEMHTFLFQCGVLWYMGQVHCGICETGLNRISVVPGYFINALPITSQIQKWQNGNLLSGFLPWYYDNTYHMTAQLSAYHL